MRGVLAAPHSCILIVVFITMGCLSSKPKVEPPDPAPEKPQSSQQIPMPGGTTSTPKGPVRERAQSQGAAWLQRPHNDGRQGMPSRKYSSRGTRTKTDRTQWDKFPPIDVTALQIAPRNLSRRRTWSAPPVICGIGPQRVRPRTLSQSSGRRNRTTSMAVHRGGHQRVRTKSTLARFSTTSERRGSPSRFPFALQGLLPNNFRFRILVVGKRECGKSSLIKIIFKADMSRSPINVSGRSDEFRPPNNRHLIVHECSASGPGEIQVIRDFITTRNHNSRPDMERIHAIWICIPMSDVIQGQVDEEGVRMLLDIGVPLVIVFTKFDLAPSSRDDYEERCRSLFGNVPAEIVSTQQKFRHLVNKLVATTDGEIISHSRNNSAPSEAQRTPRLFPASLAWSVSQRASRGVKIQAVIEVGGQSKFWRGLWSGDDFHGQTLGSCIKVIHADIVGVWNLPSKDRYPYLSSKEFREEISYLVEDLSGSPCTTPRTKTGPAWLNNHHGNSTEKICLVVGYIIDLTHILCRVFSSRNVSPGVVQSAIKSFSGSHLKTSIHNDIRSFITAVPQFQFHDNDVIIAKIRDLTLRNCDPPWSDAPPGQ